MISALSRPRVHFGTITFSVWTFSRPSFFIASAAHAMARVRFSGTTQPVTVSVGEFGEPLPRKIVGGGRLDKTRGGVTIGVDPARPACAPASAESAARIAATHTTKGGCA